MKPQVPTTGEGAAESSGIAPELIADVLVWLVSVLATPIVLSTWASTGFLVAWVLGHTVAFWGYVYSREHFPDGRRWRTGRLATSVMVWGSVPLSAALYGAYDEHEALVFLVVVSFVSLRSIVPPQ